MLLIMIFNIYDLQWWLKIICIFER